jgi:putative flippase GtrA
MTALIKRELAIFLIVGLLTVGIDFLLYQVLIHLQPLGLSDISFAKGFGFIGGTVFAYFANRFWTFNQQRMRSGSVFRFTVVYIVGLASNIMINFLSLKWLSSFTLPLEYALLTAFIFATSVSAILNFIGMKFFVFTERKFNAS